MMATEVLSYQFDDIVVDLKAGRVLRAGLPVQLEPKAFDLLVLLVARSGELVTRQDVLDRVWAGVYVTDNAVARVVAQIRRGLGDSARDSRYIETVPTRGYRFILPVQQIRATPNGPTFPRPVDGPAPVPETRTPVPAPDAPARPLWAAGLAALALVSIFLAWRSQHRPTDDDPALTRTQVTSSAALDAFPAWSPDGHTLAYASDRSGRFEIFIRDLAAGGDRLALTSDGQHNVQPAWSPDGTQVAYHSAGRGGIWVLPRTGGQPRQVSRFGSRPAWSPDGRRLAFQGAAYSEPSASAFETFGPSSLWVVDAAGGAPQRVTEGWRPEGSHSRPTWFPDGQRLFFATQRLDSTSFWVVDLPTRALTRAIDVGTRALDVTLTPDGRAAYYVRLDDHFDLWRLDLASDGTPQGTPRQIIPPSELDLRHVAVHPDGQRLAYVALATVSGLRTLPLHPDGVPSGPSTSLAADAVRSARRPSFGADPGRLIFERQSAGRPPNLWLLDLPSGAVSAVTAEITQARDPVWSRDGTRIHFESGEGQALRLQALHLADQRIETVAALNTGDGPLLRPRVSPDGTRLAYTRSAEGQLEVWVRTLADGVDRRVARIGDGAAFPVWSPDGRSLAFDVWIDGHAQVYVADVATGAATRISQDLDHAWVRSWSPDGSRVAWAGALDGRWNVWSATPDGRQQRQLTTYVDEHHYVRNPEWSPRADRIVYEFASFTGNVWVAQVGGRD